MNTLELTAYFEALCARYREATGPFGLEAECEFHYTTEKLAHREAMGADTPYFDAELRLFLPYTDQKTAIIYPVGVFCEIDKEGLILDEELAGELEKIEEELQALKARLEASEDPVAEFTAATKEREEAAKAQYRAIMRQTFPPLKTALSVIIPLAVIFALYFIVRYLF